jgi:HECT-domain (ubiquitin-transferase)
MSMSNNNPNEDEAILLSSGTVKDFRAVAAHCSIEVASSVRKLELVRLIIHAIGVAETRKQLEYVHTGSSSSSSSSTAASTRRKRNRRSTNQPVVPLASSDPSPSSPSPQASIQVDHMPVEMDDSKAQHSSTSDPDHMHHEEDSSSIQAASEPNQKRRRTDSEEQEDVPHRDDLHSSNHDTSDSLRKQLIQSTPKIASTFVNFIRAKFAPDFPIDGPVSVTIFEYTVSESNENNDYAAMRMLIEHMFSSASVLGSSFVSDKDKDKTATSAAVGGVAMSTNRSSSATPTSTHTATATPTPTATATVTATVTATAAATVTTTATAAANSLVMRSSDSKGGDLQADLDIDMQTVRKFYAYIQNVQVLNTLLMSQVVKFLQNFSPREKDVFNDVPRAILRILVIMFENPNLMEPTYFNLVLGKICIIITQLSSSDSSVLESFYSSYSPADQKKLVQKMQQLLTLRLYADGSIDVIIRAATEVLHMLRKACLRSNALSLEEFYNDYINKSNFNVEDEYFRWKNAPRLRGDVFSFCKYPWLLDPSTKSRLLSAEAQQQQRQRYEDAVLQAFLYNIPSLPYLILQVRRDHIVHDTLDLLNEFKREDFKKPLKVIFLGEEGVDAGGVAKEFFQLIVRDLFDPKYGMFVYDDSMNHYWFNTHSVSEMPEFELIGLILGLAIYNNVILDLRFPMVVYKKLLRQPVTFQDLKRAFPELGSGLQRLLDMEPELVADLGSTFEVSIKSFGELKSYDLKTNGKNISVTADNRQEFVSLYTKFTLEDAIYNEFDHFRHGFRSLCGVRALDMCEPEELEQMICGSPVLDFDALERVTKYVGWSSMFHETSVRPDTPVVRFFWELFHEFTVEQRKRVLFFVTGSDRAPVNGLGSMKFVIQSGGSNSGMLPSAHTCFNTMILPHYPTKLLLREKLTIAIENAEGFGLR